MEPLPAPRRCRLHPPPHIDLNRPDSHPAVDMIDVATGGGYADLAERQLIDGIFNRRGGLGPVALPEGRPGSSDSGDGIEHTGFSSLLVLARFPHKPVPARGNWST